MVIVRSDTMVCCSTMRAAAFSLLWKWIAKSPVRLAAGGHEQITAITGRVPLRPQIYMMTISTAGAISEPLGYSIAEWFTKF